MLWARLHKRALRRVHRLSTATIQASNEASEFADFLAAPSSSGPSEWSASAVSSPLTGNTCTRIVCMSDTHGKHWDIPFLPPGDVLVHAGDLTKYGETDSIHSLSTYFEHQRDSGGFREVVCIAGNHDITFHEDYYHNTWSKHIRSFDPFETRNALRNCAYLEDSSANLMEGKLVAYGSPWTPYFWNWAFNLQRGEALREVWSKVPQNADVLVTHGPPRGRGDMTLHSGQFGCLDLLHEIQHRIKPRLHIFGHIHEGYGCSWDGQTMYVNASNLDMSYEAINPCIVIDLPHDKSQPPTIVQPQQWIHGTDDLLFWLNQNEYTLIAKAMEGVTPKRLSLPSGETLYSGVTYQALCDQLGLKRKRHRPVREELRTALCQLYSESFF